MSYKSPFPALRHLKLDATSEFLIFLPLPFNQHLERINIQTQNNVMILCIYAEHCIMHRCSFSAAITVTFTVKMVLNMNEIEIRKPTRDVLNIVIIAKHSNNSTNTYKWQHETTTTY